MDRLFAHLVMYVFVSVVSLERSQVYIQLAVKINEA